MARGFLLHVPWSEGHMWSSGWLGPDGTDPVEVQHLNGRSQSDIVNDEMAIASWLGVFR
jgi:hypothetical protein